MNPTQQPVWKFIANLGDASPMAHGGFFVYEDATGVYAPECVLLQPKDGETDVRDKAMHWTTWRFNADKCTFIDGVLSDNRFHPSHPAWFADSLASLASCHGQTVESVIAFLCSDDTCQRAHAWRMIGEYHGWENLDSYPDKLTRRDVYNRYRVECYK